MPSIYLYIFIFFVSFSRSLSLFLSSPDLPSACIRPGVNYDATKIDTRIASPS